MAVETIRGPVRDVEITRTIDRQKPARSPFFRTTLILDGTRSRLTTGHRPAIRAGDDVLLAGHHGYQRFEAQGFINHSRRTSGHFGAPFGLLRLVPTLICQALFFGVLFWVYLRIGGWILLGGVLAFTTVSLVILVGEAREVIRRNRARALVTAHPVHASTSPNTASGGQADTWTGALGDHGALGADAPGFLNRLNEGLRHLHRGIFNALSAVVGAALVAAVALTVLYNIGDEAKRQDIRQLVKDLTGMTLEDLSGVLEDAEGITR